MTRYHCALPLNLNITSSRERYDRTSRTLWVSTCGLNLTTRWIGSRHLERLSDILQPLDDPGQHGHSGTKRTRDPKHHWSSYRVPADQADAVCQTIIGSTVADQVVRKILADEYVLYAEKYLLPEKHAWRFRRSRHRDQTWCDATRLLHAPAEFRAFIKSLPLAEIEAGELAPRLIPAPPPPLPRAVWRCESCGLEGHRNAFLERSVPGLSGSTGVDCPRCPPRHVDGVRLLLSGQPRGAVVRLESFAIYVGD